jgi:hypothetical protein
VRAAGAGVRAEQDHPRPGDVRVGEPPRRLFDHLLTCRADLDDKTILFLSLAPLEPKTLSLVERAVAAQPLDVREVGAVDACAASPAALRLLVQPRVSSASCGEA